MTSKDPGESQSLSDFVRFEASSGSKSLSEQVVPLLEERLMVDLKRRKVGEVAVRKEIEAHTLTLHIEVPVRQEKIIVEQLSPEYKRLAEINLSQDTSSEIIQNAAIEGITVVGIDRLPLATGRDEDSKKVYGEVDSPSEAITLLKEIAKVSNHDCQKVKIEIVLKDAAHQETYQALLNP
jgi:Domain of unknown function (DUF2382)